MTSALNTVTDSVLIVDKDWVIEYANPSMRYLLGRSPDELQGTDARRLIVLPHDWEPVRGDELATVTRSPRKGIVSLTGSSGTGSPRDAFIHTVHNASGAVTGSVLVFPRGDDDPTSSQQPRWEIDRAAILRIMAEVRPLATVTETATALCLAIQRIDDIDGAMVILAPDVGDLVIVSNGEVTDPEFLAGSHIALEDVEKIMSTTVAAPWMIDFGDPSAREIIGSGLVDSLKALGITASAYAAIRTEGKVTGVLSIASMAPDGPKRIAGLMDSLEHLGGMAGVVLGRQTLRFQEQETAHNLVQKLIDQRLFSPVFQPIVSLGDGAIIGYEALTRFDDDRPPNQVITAAHAAGLGLELEEACVRAALETTSDLPAGLFLSVNFSPAAVLSGSASRTTANAGHRVVVEITENAPVDNYDELRRSLRDESDVLVAVDDAGAGFASLEHILELQPDFVKLDLSLVRGVDHDPARAAMIAGMTHFAELTGTRLIAEGVETQAEADALLGLGVEFAQGYHFGRPAASIRP